MMSIMERMQQLHAEEEVIRRRQEEQEEQEELVCYRCGCVVDKDDVKQVNGENYCPDCVERCEYCYEYVDMDETCYANLELTWRRTVCACETCADANFQTCNHCGYTVSPSGISMEDGNLTICDNCEDNYRVCYGCSNIVEYEDAYYSERRGEYFCVNCYPEDSDRIQHYCNYQVDPDKDYVFRNMPDEEDVTLHFGIELEVDYGDDRNELANDLFEKIEDADSLIMCKEDGSLDDEGLEIVSYPCSFRFMIEKFPFEEIAGICQKNNYKSHDTSTCGMHIHISRIGLGESSDDQDLAIAKMMVLFDRFWEKIVTFSRRTQSQLDHYAQKMDTGIEVGDSEETAKTKSKRSRRNYNRYKAINIMNQHTVEFRVFRGSLNVRTIRATIQFVNWIVSYVLTHSLQNCLDVKWSELFNGQPYAELAEYLKIRGLL